MPNIHGGNIFSFAHEHSIEPRDVIDFSANINPLGPSQKGIDALQDKIAYISHYPDITNDDVLNTVADVYGVPKESILLGNGAAELLYAIGRLPNFTGSFVPAPGFSEYQASMDAACIPVRSIYYKQREEQNGTPYFEIPYLALQTFAAELKGQDGRIIVFLGNPNNPDGTLLDIAYVRELAAMLRDARSLLVIDESFIDFIGTESLQDNSYSMRSLINNFDNVIIVHSFTKFYAVPGLRLGAVFADPKLINELRPFIPAWSVNTLAQAYAVAAINDSEYIKKSKQFLAEEQRFMYDALHSIDGLNVYKPTANYMLIEVQHASIDVEFIQKELEKEYIMIRNCAHYKGLGPNWMRVAIKNREQNKKIVELLTALFK